MTFENLFYGINKLDMEERRLRNKLVTLKMPAEEDDDEDDEDDDDDDDED